jgi:hypothetical protein
MANPTPEPFATLRGDVPNSDFAQSVNLSHLLGDHPGTPGGGNTCVEDAGGSATCSGMPDGAGDSAGSGAAAVSPERTGVHWARWPDPRVHPTMEMIIARQPRTLMTGRTRALW